MESETIKPGGIATPLQGIEAINKVIQVLFTYKRAITYKELTPAVKLNKTTVSQALSASRDLGLTALAGKKGLYVLTKDGEEYGRLLTAGKRDEARSLFRNILQKQPLWTEILTFLKATYNQERDPIDLVLDVERKLGKQWSRSMRKRLRDSYVSILSYARLVEKRGRKIISQIKPEEITREMPSNKMISAMSKTLPSSEFAKLAGDDFKFEVRKSLDALEFAESQFHAWMDYLKKQLAKSETKSEG